MLLKTQIFEKKAIFPVKKINWTIFLVLSSMRSLREHFIGVHGGESRTKEPILNETKPPIPKMRQNRRFRKRQNLRFCEKEQIAMKIVSLIKASSPIYQYLAIILPITIRKWDTTNLMQFPLLFATNNYSRTPTPKILLKPSLPFNLNVWCPPPIFLSFVYRAPLN